MGEHGRDGLLLPAAQGAAGGPRGKRVDRHQRRRKLAAAPVGTGVGPLRRSAAVARSTGSVVGVRTVRVGRPAAVSAMIRRVAGADVVIPEPAPLGALRLAWLKLRHRGRLRAGPGVRLGRDAQVRIARNARVELGDGCYLGDGCRVEAVAGTLRIGPRARVGPRAFVVAHADVSLGEGCVIGDFAAVGVLGAPGRIGPVVVGAAARIAAHATVASGATVPAGGRVASYEGLDFAPDA